MSITYRSGLMAGFEPLLERTHTVIDANGGVTCHFRVRMPSIGKEGAFTVDADSEAQARDLAMARVGAVAERLMREAS